MSHSLAVKTSIPGTWGVSRFDGPWRSKQASCGGRRSERACPSPEGQSLARHVVVAAVSVPPWERAKQLALALAAAFWPDLGGSRCPCPACALPAGPEGHRIQAPTSLSWPQCKWLQRAGAQVVLQPAGGPSSTLHYACGFCVSKPPSGPPGHPSVIHRRGAPGSPPPAAAPRRLRPPPPSSPSPRLRQTTPCYFVPCPAGSTRLHRVPCAHRCSLDTSRCDWTSREQRERI